MTAKRAISPSRLASLTGLRWFAAFLVFLHHLKDYVPNNAFGDTWVQLFSPGFLGVSFFFILSGFVLTWSHRDGDRPQAFYRKRFARIAPAYWVTLVVVTAGRATTAPPGGPVREMINAVPSIIGIQAWLPAESIHFGGNSVEWSVSAELFFYAAFPFLLPLLWRRRTGFALVTIASVMFIVTPVVLHPSGAVSWEKWAVYILPAQRMTEFILGMALATAIGAGRRLPIPVPLALIVAALAYIEAGFAPYWAQVALITAVPFMVLIGAAATSDLRGRTGFLGSTVVSRLGEWSFSFYLVHAFVITTAFNLLHRVVSVPTAFAIGAPLALMGSLAAAIVLYYAVEKPLETRLRHARPRPDMSESA